jgi:hypothetical protein
MLAGNFVKCGRDPLQRVPTTFTAIAALVVLDYLRKLAQYGKINHIHSNCSISGIGDAFYMVEKHFTLSGVLYPVKHWLIQT